MSKPMGLIASLELCVGCFACEVACKQEHHLPEGQKGIQVVTLGPYEPRGELAMDFVPMATERCDLCADRRAAGQRPFCAQVCPTQALRFYSGEKILGLLRRGERWHICKISA
jgi:Fe-S-cluster-containing dehydrogenase component